MDRRTMEPAPAKQTKHLIQRLLLPAGSAHGQDEEWWTKVWRVARAICVAAQVTQVIDHLPVGGAAWSASPSAPPNVRDAAALAPDERTLWPVATSSPEHLEAFDHLVQTHAMRLGIDPFDVGSVAHWPDYEDIRQFEANFVEQRVLPLVEKRSRTYCIERLTSRPPHLSRFEAEALVRMARKMLHDPIVGEDREVSRAVIIQRLEELIDRAQKAGDMALEHKLLKDLARMHNAIPSSTKRGANSPFAMLEELSRIADEG